VGEARAKEHPFQQEVMHSLTIRAADNAILDLVDLAAVRLFFAPLRLGVSFFSSVVQIPGIHSSAHRKPKPGSPTDNPIPKNKNDD
jgi:hypothetical protein